MCRQSPLSCKTFLYCSFSFLHTFLFLIDTRLFSNYFFPLRKRGIGLSPINKQCLVFAVSIVIFIILKLNILCILFWKFRIYHCSIPGRILKHILFQGDIFTLCQCQDGIVFSIIFASVVQNPNIFYPSEILLISTNRNTIFYVIHNPVVLY